MSRVYLVRHGQAGTRPDDWTGATTIAAYLEFKHETVCASAGHTVRLFNIATDRSFSFEGKRPTERIDIYTPANRHLRRRSPEINDCHHFGVGTDNRRGATGL